MNNNVFKKRKETERRGRIDTILRASRKVFLEKGYKGATMSSISREAELSTGAIYFYFKGKDEIYGRICEDIMKLTIRILKRGRNESGSMRERLISMTKAYVGFYKNYPEDFDLLDSAYKQAILPEYINKRIELLVQEALSFVNDIFVQAVKKGELSKQTDTWKLTMSMWAAIEGVLYIHKRDFLADANISLDDIILHQMNIFESGIKTKFGVRNK